MNRKIHKQNLPSDIATLIWSTVESMDGLLTECREWFPRDNSLDYCGCGNT